MVYNQIYLMIEEYWINDDAILKINVFDLQMLRFYNNDQLMIEEYNNVQSKNVKQLVDKLQKKRK